MPNSSVLKLDEYRERRGLRQRLAESLLGSDESRSELLQHLARLTSILDADRVATVWVDEYGPGLVHPHVVLDLLSDRPRRSFSPEPLRRAWESGVPGVVEATGQWGGGSAWTLAVALGSDGTRSWFLVADAVTARASLSQALRDRIMFLAGECSSVVLHRDLDSVEGVDASEARRKRPRFAGWPILQDIEGREADEAESRRIAMRFVVARLPRLLVDDELTVQPDRLRQQAERAREEMTSKGASLETGPEQALWHSVLDAFEAGDLERLGEAMLQWGTMVESRAHLHGATELYTTAYEIFAATGQVPSAVEAARFAGRAQRHLALWEESLRWYGIARGVAEAASMDAKLAVILDGTANIHRDRGNHPAARSVLEEALGIAQRSGDASAIGTVHHGFLALEHVAGNLETALHHGWKAVRSYELDEQRVQALASLAGALIDVGALDAAEDAWTVVVHLSHDEFYQVYARMALGYLAALRKDGAAFARLAAEADAMGWDTMAAPAKAELLHYRGLGYRALGDMEQAETWLRKAVAYAEAKGFSRTLFEAEQALAELSGPPAASGDEKKATRRGTPPSAPEDVRTGLREMRRQCVGASA